MITRVIVNGRIVDTVTTPFGIRALAWSADAGLTLNGKTYKLSGGCIHDDNGVLGACAFDRAEERKIQLLKAAGFSALRTAHNPPSPELLDACDRLGMLVMDEAFDCWVNGKNTYDYHHVFKDWWQRDLDSMARRDRNHPAIVMWSIGNEIPGVFSAMGNEYTPKLVAEIHSLDRTRPVTNGSNGWPAEIQHRRPPGSTSNDANAGERRPGAPGPGRLDRTGYRRSNFLGAGQIWGISTCWATASLPPILRNIVWNMGEKLYMAVRQPTDRRKIIVAGWAGIPSGRTGRGPARKGNRGESTFILATIRCAFT